MLVLDHIAFRYPGDSEDALQDVCLQVEPGSTVAILGANGSGKSTLAALAGGFLAPGSGSVCIDGEMVDQTADSHWVHAKAGVVFQDPTAQIVTSRVEDEVAFGPENLGLAAEQIEARVARSLELAGLVAEAHRNPHNLSGGQLQRLVIASTLAMEPSYLFLDEPTAMLDEEGRQQVHRVIAHLKGSGMAVTVITHSLEEASLCDRAVVLQRGKIVFDGSLEELEEDDLLRFGLARKKTSLDPSRAESPGLQEAGEYAEFSEVDFAYEQLEGNHPVLQNCSVRFPAGQVSCLLGPNGSGKSTLLRLLAGLEAPQAGTVSLCGKKAAPGDAGFCMQHPDLQLFADTVAEDVGFATKMRKLPRQEITDTVSSCLSTVGLAPELYAERSPFSLSGGQARRAALAGVLAVGSRFLLLDEPASGLDASGLDRLATLINELQGRGIGIIMTCHDRAFAREVSHNLFTVEGGTVRRLTEGACS